MRRKDSVFNKRNYQRRSNIVKKMNKKGFTIVELVIVIAVIGILASVLIPTFSGVVENAKASARLQKARNSYTEYLVAHPTAEIDYIKVVENDKEYIYDIHNDYKVVNSASDDKTVLTVGTGLKDICAAAKDGDTVCGDCGWQLPNND